MEERSDRRPAPRSAWKPGQTGNPGGRPKRKPLTVPAILYLASRVSSGSKKTHADKIIERLVEIIYKAEPKEAIKAAELIWKYLEGSPQQTVEIQGELAMQDISARTGAPVAKIREIAMLVARRNALASGEIIDGVSEPVETPIRTGERQPSVKRVRE